MQQTWRWFGPHDVVTLSDARQAGATGIVTSLHHLAPGDSWSIVEINKRKAEIESAGLVWAVVESVDVSEAIKTRSGAFRQHLDAYCQTLRNLADCGIRTVCYNFMPVLDWTRTDIHFVMPDGAVALRYDPVALAVFDLYVLKRPGAETDWSEDRKRRAHDLMHAMTPSAKDALALTLLAGLPGTNTVRTLDEIRERLKRYEDISVSDLRSNLGDFLRAVCPVAEEVGIRLCIHPDDPPRPLLGLPRIVSTAADFEFLLAQYPAANGITFCTGSLSGRAENDLVAMVRHFASRIYFVHLRAVKRDADGEGFVEAPHLDGDVDMVAVIRELVAEQRRRDAQAETLQIPFRADHGHQMLTDFGKASVPGYPAVGRLRGLAELRGVLRAVEALT